MDLLWAMNNKQHKQKAEKQIETYTVSSFNGKLLISPID